MRTAPRRRRNRMQPYAGAALLDTFPGHAAAGAGFGRRGRGQVQGEPGAVEFDPAGQVGAHLRRAGGRTRCDGLPCRRRSPPGSRRRRRGSRRARPATGLRKPPRHRHRSDRRAGGASPAQTSARRGGTTDSRGRPGPMGWLTPSGETLSQDTRRQVPTRSAATTVSK